MVAKFNSKTHSQNLFVVFRAVLFAFDFKIGKKANMMKRFLIIKQYGYKKRRI
jgi:hypothetical protein